MHNLSRVERELMVHISLGLKYPAIAKEMGYSEHTLRDMNKRLRNEFGCKSTVHLVAILIRQGHI